MRVKSRVKAGAADRGYESEQHNQTVKELSVKMKVKAGVFRLNHNQTLNR